MTYVWIQYHVTLISRLITKPKMVLASLWTILFHLLILLCARKGIHSSSTSLLSESIAGSDLTRECIFCPISRDTL